MGGEHTNACLAEVERLEERGNEAIAMFGLVKETGGLEGRVIAANAAEEIDDGR